MPRVTQDELRELSWFHGIDFGEGLSVEGRIPKSMPQNYTLFGIYSFLEHIDPREQRVIDIGTMDGLMAFILKNIGAAPVVATDLFDRRQFRLAREILEYENEVEYHAKLDISHMVQRFGESTFDLAVFSGVLYHLISPLEALLICRQLLRRNGLILLETCYDRRSTEPTLRFNMGEISAPFDEPTTYFLPTLSALLSMLRTASFDPLAAIQFRTGSSRVSVVARAVRPSEVRNKTALQRRHDSYVDTPNHFAFGDRFHKLENGRETPSTIRYTGPESLSEELDILTYLPRVPYQPPPMIQGHRPYPGLLGFIGRS